MTQEYNSRLIDREIFFGNPEITGAKLSPDGQFISFIKAYKGVMNIWLKAKNQSFDEALPLTKDLDRPIRSYFWSRDSRYIIYAQDKGGDENFSLFIVEPSVGLEASEVQLRELTPYEGTTSYVASLPKRFKDKIIVAVNDRDKAWHDYYSYSISSGERELLVLNDQNYNSVYFDLDCKPRFAGRSLPDGGNEILALEDGTAKRIFYAGLEESISPIKFREDGKVYFVSNLGDPDLAGLYLYDSASEGLTFIESDPLNEVDLENVSFSELTDEILATIYVGDKKRIYWKSEPFERDYNTLKEKFSGSEISIQSTTEDEQEWLIYVSSDRDPGSAYYFNRAQGRIDFLYTPRPELPTKQLVEMYPVRYPSLDGLEIPAYLSLPEVQEKKALPAVIFVHGGPWARDYWGYNPYAQFLANRGYAVLQVNFRGSTGFGKKFLNAAINEWGEKMQDDLTAGCRYLIDEGIADAKRIAIMGGSYGGYATLAGLCFTPEVYAAGVSIVGPSNLFTLLETIPPYWESARIMFHKRMGDPNTEAGQAQLKRQSPFFHAHKIKAPLLVAQGANDPRVKKSESDQIVIAMRDHGLPVEYINFPDEGHGFAKPENSMAFIAVMEKFLAKHLGGRYQESLDEKTAEIINNVEVDITSLEMPEIISEKSLEQDVLIPEREVSVQNHTYKVTIDMQGQKMEFDIVRQIELQEGIIRITDSADSAMGQMRDTTELTADTFVPVSRHVSQGPMTIDLSCDERKVNGKIDMNGSIVEISQKFKSHYLLDNAMCDLYLTLSSSSDIAERYIRVFDVQTQKLDYFKVELDQEESRNEYLCHKVHLIKYGDKTDKTSYWISKDTPYKMVAKTSVSKAMGGAVINLDLLEKNNQ